VTKAKRMRQMRKKEKYLKVRQMLRKCDNKGKKCDKSRESVSKVEKVCQKLRNCDNKVKKL